MILETKTPVPSLLFRPLLVGNGNLARHLTHYFHLKSISYLSWTRPRVLDSNFEKLLAEASSVWLLVSDSAIGGMVEQLKNLRPELPVFHASAALAVTGAATIHPLQTFGPELYSIDAYQKLTFTLIKEEWAQVPAEGKRLVERMGNPTQSISNQARTLYHARCVMISNFPQILWTAVFSSLESSQGLSETAFQPLLKQSVENFLAYGKDALTGPLVRNDQMTIKKHLDALSSSPLLPTYQNFIELYAQLQKESLKS